VFPTWRRSGPSLHTLEPNTPVATKIKLTRIGKMREPHYRVVIADARTKRDGRSIETIGEYHPKNDPSVIKIDAERVAYWLGVGAQPTEAVAALLKVTGDWQKFKGLPAPAPMKFAEPKADKRTLFDAALRDSEGEPAVAATTPRKRAAKQAEEPAAGAAKQAEEPAAGAAKQAEEPAAGAGKQAEEPAAEPEAPVAEATDAPAAESPAAEATEAAE
jgi:small subunit ribosomal protein S16